MLTQRDRPVAQRGAGRPLWVHGPIADTLLGWSWLPIAVVVHLLGPHLSLVQSIVGVIFLVSFAHQPLTLALVYGDPVQRSAHRRLYRWAPVVAVAVILAGMNLSLTLVALMAALWNAEHTLMQRYGVMRIYGRKAGDDHGALEKPMLIVWLVAGIAFIGGFVDLDSLVQRLGIDQNNARGVHLLDPWRLEARAVFVVAVVSGAVLAVRWWRAERSFGLAANRAKHVYTAGTLGLVLAVMVDPIAGVAGYVAAHAIEYFAVVHSSLRHRADVAPVARATNTTVRRGVTYALYFAFVAAVVLVTWNVLGGRLYAFAILFFGALHILYDGFVWKLRRPAVAASLGITPVS